MKHIAFLSILIGFVGFIGCSDDLSTIEVQNPPETSSTNPVIDGEKTTPKEPVACHDSDCPEGEKCIDGSCQPICESDCPEGEKCIDGSCQPICESDCPEGEKCKDGSCQPICDDGTTYCDGKCFDFAVLHLAACHTCADDYCDSNDNFDDGCDIYVKSSDKNNCGGCGIACEKGENCFEGTCTSGCKENEAFCNGQCINLTDLHLASCDSCIEHFCDGDDNILNGCEIDTNSDDNNCGGCGITCEKGEKCSEGTCTSMCKENEAFCNEQCINLTDLHLASCDSCAEHFCDGDDNILNGCEIDTNTDDKNCGKCGNACAKGESCQNGKCAYACKSPSSTLVDGLHFFGDIDTNLPINVQAMVSAINYYQRTIETTGVKLVYSVKNGDNYFGRFDDKISGKIDKTINCDTGRVWINQDFSVDKNPAVGKHAPTSMGPGFERIDFSDSPTLKKLISSNRVKVGDVLMALGSGNNHRFIYLGKKEDGKHYVFDSGHGANGFKTENGKEYMKNFIMPVYDGVRDYEHYKISKLYRLKKDYKPLTYRDCNGKITNWQE